ncbi:MAG: hypothetical protein E6K90_02540 [Thaumarchaeota archaeon]|nr:MAG: hypothetical protein E6K90_02540 [Nitrososphaerota archaeon]
MSSVDFPLRELFQQRERDYLLSNVKVSMRSAVENIEVGDLKVEKLREGETAELPRWVAEEFASLGLAEVAEEPFETEILKSLSREKMIGAFQLSNLAPDFYLRMKRRLAYLRDAAGAGRVRKEDYERLRASSYDLIGIRLGKLLALSSSSTTLSAIADKLTPEEKVFFASSQSLTKEWRTTLLGVKA